MVKLDHPRKWRALLNGVWTRAEHHGQEALPIIASLAAALLRHGDLPDWPSATSAKLSGAPGAQVRFQHGQHYLKLRWDHDNHAIVLAEVLGNREGGILERFRENDSPQAVDRKMRTALDRLRRAAA